MNKVIKSKNTKLHTTKQMKTPPQFVKKEPSAGLNSFKAVAPDTAIARAPRKPFKTGSRTSTNNLSSTVLDPRANYYKGTK